MYIYIYIYIGIRSSFNEESKHSNQSKYASESKMSISEMPRSSRINRSVTLTKTSFDNMNTIMKSMTNETQNDSMKSVTIKPTKSRHTSIRASFERGLQTLNSTPNESLKSKSPKSRHTSLLSGLNSNDNMLENYRQASASIVQQLGLGLGFNNIASITPELQIPEPGHPGLGLGYPVPDSPGHPSPGHPGHPVQPGSGSDYSGPGNLGLNHPGVKDPNSPFPWTRSPSPEPGPRIRVREPRIRVREPSIPELEPYEATDIDHAMISSALVRSMKK
jgi:hypothetical protein